MTETAARKEKYIYGEKPIKFRPGDLVVYPAHGVGRIQSIECREVDGKKQEFFILHILENSMVIMIPTQNVTAVCLREIIGKDEVPKIYEVLKKGVNLLINNMTWNRRQKEYMDKIRTGSIFEVAEVFRDLFLAKFTKELSFGERKLFDIAQGLLINEICVAEDRDKKTTMRKIKMVLKDSIETINKNMDIKTGLTQV